ncbi:YhjD/YihY/BrkB family envelope integrity protein [Streptomyces sp. bgisy154]|uniref:YhjD/YihY/BrkB family envelope integrity protein n=1 Tax=Streptomyces sp. bgisy154 TaxID=3413794 RepID=UPI003D74F4F0
MRARQEGETTAGIDRERVLRTLTFWLRPAFALRVLNRFQRVAGFDRSMALASSAFTALVPLALLAGVVLGNLVHVDAAQRIIQRYDLSGAGAEAVTYLFSPQQSEDASTGVFSALFLTVSVLSFARAAQRLFEQTWELKPLSVRNSRNGLWWILTLGAYGLLTGWISAVLGGAAAGLPATVCEAAVTAVFLTWSGWILAAKRIAWRELVPFGVIAAALMAVYSWGADFYLPRLFNSYADRYGVVGSVFAMLSALFAAMVVLVASAAVGREVGDELVRIRDGLQPSEHEVRQQWESLVEDTRSRWHKVRDDVSHRRRKRTEP